MTERTRSAMATQISTLLADNTAGDITASDARSIQTDQKDSAYFLLDNSSADITTSPSGLTYATGSDVQSAISELDAAILATHAANTGVILTNGSALKTTTTAAQTALLSAYDVDGAAYKAFGTLTANNTPSLAFAQPSGATLTWDGGAIGGSTPAAVTGTNLTATGYVIHSVGNALTAAGTTRADALVLSHEVNNVTTAASGTGVVLPAGVAGMRLRVYNNGANLIKVYANGSDTIDGTAGSTGVSLTNALRCDYECVATNTWLSAKLGATST